jgi:hypothetical protein
VCKQAGVDWYRHDHGVISLLSTHDPRAAGASPHLLSYLINQFKFNHVAGSWTHN